jgi:hypothetical protein
MRPRHFYLLARRYQSRYTLVFLLFSGVLLALSLEPVDLSGVHFALAEPEWIAPAWSLSSIINLALPLVLVSLSGQFLPGMAILQNAGYSVKAKPIITATSLASIPVAFFKVLLPPSLPRLPLQFVQVRMRITILKSAMFRVCLMGCFIWLGPYLPGRLWHCFRLCRRHLLLF